MRSPKKTVKKKELSDEDFDMEEEVTPKKSRAAPKRKVKEPSPPSEEEDDFEEDQFSEEEVVKPRKRVGRTASQKVAKYSKFLMHNGG